MTTGVISHQNLLSELSVAIQHVQSQGGWTVLLCPSSGVALQAATTLAALVPGDVAFSGRTASFSDGKITVVEAHEEPAIPDPFWLRFLGWGETDITSGVTAWRTRAAGVLSQG